MESKMVCQCGHAEEYHDKKYGCIECSGNCFCAKFTPVVPVEPAQPEICPCCFHKWHEEPCKTMTAYVECGCDIVGQCKKGIADARAGRVTLWADVKEELGIAQPELPRELPQRIILPQNPLIRAQLDKETLRQTDEVEANKTYQNALKRIAELEAELTEARANSSFGLKLSCESLMKQNLELQSQEVSLKEQLAVFIKDIPKGKYCYIMDTHTLCHYINSGVCLIRAVKLAWDSDEDGYLKCAGCPVPAIEENKDES